MADARAVPLESGSYDIVTSQFGIEYAGLDAINEIARLPVSGGRLALLLHHRHGGIYRQCSASLDAIRILQESHFIPRTIETFKAGFAAYRGESNSNVPDAAVKMNSAIKAVESIMIKHGSGVADGIVIRFYKDIATIHSRLPKFEKSEVLGWLEGMQQELEAYAERMASMCAAAIDGASFDGLSDTLERCG